MFGASFGGKALDYDYQDMATSHMLCVGVTTACAGVVYDGWHTFNHTRTL